MLPSLAISISPPHFLAGDFICSKLPRVGPTLLLGEEHVTYLPPVMSTISHGLLARPKETSMVLTVAFSDKRSLFTAVLMHHSPIAFHRGQDPYDVRKKTPDRDMGMVPESGE
jgi:hypothetical protein